MSRYHRLGYAGCYVNDGAQAYAQSSSPSPQETPDPQAAAPAAQNQGGSSNEGLEEVVVTGFRHSLQQGVDLKREAVGVRDSIVAEDIGNNLYGTFANTSSAGRRAVIVRSAVETDIDAVKYEPGIERI